MALKSGGRETLGIIKLIRQAQGLAIEDESKLEKLTPHVPGIVTFAEHGKPLPWSTTYKAVVVFADISGFTSLCERYSAMESAGINMLTKTLNEYLGALVSLILKAEGDILKFAGDAVLAVWRVNSVKHWLSTIEKVIVCCLDIQKQCGAWKTDIGITLTVKLGISSGRMEVTFLGNEHFHAYVERGQSISDANLAESFCKSGYIVVSPYTWEVCRKTLYTFEVLHDGQHVRICSVKDHQALQTPPEVVIMADSNEFIAETEKEKNQSPPPEDFGMIFKKKNLGIGSSATAKIIANKVAKRKIMQIREKEAQLEENKATEDITASSKLLSGIDLKSSEVGPETVQNKLDVSDNKSEETSANSIYDKVSKDPESGEEQIVTESKGEKSDQGSIGLNISNPAPKMPTSSFGLVPLTHSSVPSTTSVTPTSAPDADPSMPASAPDPSPKPEAGTPASVKKANPFKRDFKTLKNVVKCVTEMKLDQSLRLYILPPVLKKLDDNQPLEYLSEMRQVSIVFINLIVDESVNNTVLLQEVFQCIFTQAQAMHGCLNKVFEFDKGCTFLVIFGLPGFKHERDCANALICAHKVKKNLLEIAGVRQVSIGVTTGTTFCGVVGHKNRHEYSVIGRKVNMAARLMMHYKDKVTCDDNTFQLSRLSGHNFHILVTKRMKGLRNVGVIREYIETSNDSSNVSCVPKFEYPFIGREEYQKIFFKAINLVLGYDTKEEKNDHFIFSGVSGIGKTRLLDHFINKANDYSLRTVTCALRFGDAMNQYFITYYIVRMLLAIGGFSHQIEKDVPLLEALCNAGYEHHLHKLNPILACKFPKEKDVEDTDEITPEDILCFIAMKSVEKCPGVLIALDDVHHMDESSWLFLNKLAALHGIIIVCTVITSMVENPTCLEASTFIERTDVRLRELVSLEDKHIATLACQLMDVTKIPPELPELLLKWTQGVPGWCERLLIDMAEKGQILMKMEPSILIKPGMVGPPTRFLRRKSIGGVPSTEFRGCHEIFMNCITEKSNAGSVEDEQGESFLADLGYIHEKQDVCNDKDTMEKIAVFAPNIVASEIPIPDVMKEMIVARLDSMRATEQLVVKCAAVLGSKFPRQMIERILPNVHPVKARKSFKRLTHLGIFECAKLPLAKYNDFMKGCKENEVVDWTVCYCIKDDNDYNQDLCNEMRFRSPLIQQTAYEILLEAQRQQLHAKAAEYLEKTADEFRSKVPDHVLMRIPKEEVTTEKEDSVADFLTTLMKRKSNRRRRSSKVQDLSTAYYSVRGRRFGFSLDNESINPLVLSLQEKFCIGESIQSLLEHLLPIYEMILHHWRLAKKKVNSMEQCIEAIAAAVALKQVDKAQELLSSVNIAMKDMDADDGITNQTRVILQAKIYRLKYKILEMQGDAKAFKHLQKAAKVLHVPRPSCGLSLLLRNIQQNINITLTKDFSQRVLLQCNQWSVEQVSCLMDLKEHHKNQNHRKLQLFYAKQHLYWVMNQTLMVHQMVEGYFCMMEYYHNHGQMDKELQLGSEMVTSCAEFNNKFCEEDLRTLARAYFYMSLITLQRGELRKANATGYGSTDIGKKLADQAIVADVFPHFAFSSILLTNFKESEDVLQAVKSSADKTLQCWYHSFRMDVLFAEEGFTDTKVSECLSCASELLKNRNVLYNHFTSRLYLAMSMSLLFSVLNQWEDAQRWFGYWDVFKVVETSTFASLSLAKKIEVQLISVAVAIQNKNKEHKNELLKIAEKDLRTLEHQCQQIHVAMPRCLHLQSYLALLRGKRWKAKKLLKRGFKLASKNFNRLESNFMRRHLTDWFQEKVIGLGYSMYGDNKTCIVEDICNQTKIPHQIKSEISKSSTILEDSHTVANERLLDIGGAAETQICQVPPNCVEKESGAVVQGETVNLPISYIDTCFKEKAQRPFHYVWPT